jgi:hypothetical protein
MAKHEIEASVPDGWEAVAYRWPLKGEWFINNGGFLQECNHEMCTTWLIVRKIEQPPKYRPFRDADDFMRHYRGQWIAESEGDNCLEKAIGVNCDRVSTENGWVAFDDQERASLVQYVNGERIETPFGVLVDDDTSEGE